MPEDPKKSLKLRELITNVLPRYTYDCWAIIPSVLRLMNLRVHADLWSPPTNDMLVGVDGSYDSDQTGIGTYTRQSYIAHNENLFKLLQQAADDDVSWATEGDRLATDGNSYSRQICGRTGDGLFVLEYWYFRHEQTTVTFERKSKLHYLSLMESFRRKVSLLMMRAKLCAISPSVQ